MKYLITTAFFLFSLCSNSQSLSIERVKRIKEATVKITIDSSSGAGTGFFIDSFGTIATCLHVVFPSFVADANGNITRVRKIFVQTNAGEKIEYGFPVLTQSEYVQFELFDVAIIIPVRPTKGTKFLPLGNFELLNEGQEVYGCGYPFGMSHPFVSKGIVSTKFSDTIAISHSNGIGATSARKTALLDMTLNSGNSGGPILVLGRTVKDDVVIGIADFKVTPMGQDASQIIQNLKRGAGAVSFGKDVNNKEVSNIDPVATLAWLSEILEETSDGVSGMISIQYLNAQYKKMRTKISP